MWLVVEANILTQNSIVLETKRLETNQVINMKLNLEYRKSQTKQKKTIGKSID